MIDDSGIYGVGNANGGTYKNFKTHILYICR